MQQKTTYDQLLIRLERHKQYLEWQITTLKAYAEKRAANGHSQH